MMFTIITPCYNSSETLMRAYNSLLSVDYEDFEWILIDDASSDEGKTRDLIFWISKNAPFPVQFVFLEHNHFCSKSVFEATKLARGEYACILDHDDELTKDSLQLVSELLNAYDVTSNSTIAGVCGRCIDENHDLIGPRFADNTFVATEGEVRFKRRITSELFQFTKVEILNKYFSKMKPGYTNGFCWAKISENFAYVYTNEIFRVYDTSVANSYSSLYKKSIRFPDNKVIATRGTIKSYGEFLIFNPSYSLRLCASSVAHAIAANKPVIVSGMPLFYYYSLPFSLPLAFLRSRGCI